MFFLNLICKPSESAEPRSSKTQEKTADKYLNQNK